MYGKHIPQHNNLSPTSLLITLTLIAFVAGATNQTDKKTQTGSSLQARLVCPMKPSIAKKVMFVSFRYLRPSMLQHLLRRLVFDVPILNEYAKMPLKVCKYSLLISYIDFLVSCSVVKSTNRDTSRF